MNSRKKRKASYSQVYDYLPIMPRLILSSGGPDDSKVPASEPSERSHIRTTDYLSSGSDIPPQDLTLIYIRYQI